MISVRVLKKVNTAIVMNGDSKQSHLFPVDSHRSHVRVLSLDIRNTIRRATEKFKDATHLLFLGGHAWLESTLDSSVNAFGKKSKPTTHVSRECEIELTS
jgi:hypothetical protein